MKTPLSLATLRRHAAAITAPAGHRMRWNPPYGRPAVPHLGQMTELYSQTGRCVHCGDAVEVRQKDVGSDIVGLALFSRCARLDQTPMKSKTELIHTGNAVLTRRVSKGKAVCHEHYFGFATVRRSRITENAFLRARDSHTA